MAKNQFNTGIYQIVNTVNGKRYIGSAVNLFDRKRCHYKDLKKGNHHNEHLQRSYNKYGKENFEFEIIMHCLPEHLLFFEQLHIDKYNFKNDLYNISPTAGSTLGVQFSEERKKKISEANKGEKSWAYGKPGTMLGKKQSEETRKKMSKSQTGKKHSNETKKKIGEWHKGEKNFWYRKPGPMKNKHHNEESRKKISESHKGMKGPMLGKKHSEETKEKIRKANTGKKASEETRKKMSEWQFKPIKAFIYKTGEFVGEYKSGKECAEKLNIFNQSIANVLTKRRLYHKDYTFEYVNEKDKIKQISKKVVDIHSR